MLTGEENFNQYFGNAGLVTDPATKARLERYGLRGAASERKWERFDYFYKFVSRDRVKPGNSQAARRHNLTLLDNGALYVARFTGDSPPAELDGSGKLPSDGAFDGGGEWIPLASGNRSFVDGMTAAEVYVFTRLAADKVVRPRWTGRRMSSRTRAPVPCMWR